MLNRSLANGRYLLTDLLGEGGMASVYRAYDARLRVWRAIKVLAPELGRRPKMRMRFETEAASMAQIQHPNVVKVFDIASDGDLAFMVMELVEGGTPEAWLESFGPLPPRLAVEVALQVCAGIGAAHACGVVHRDVKPANILVSDRGQCKVTDFGIAQVAEQAVQLTRTGTVMGTLGYMAPEQRNDAKGVDHRADVYSIGATLFTLLTARTTMDLFAAAQDVSLLKGLPLALMPVIVRATQYRRDKRFGSVAELADALDNAIGRLPPDPPETPPLVQTPSERRELPPVQAFQPVGNETFAQTPAPQARGETLMPVVAGEGQTLLPAFDTTSTRVPEPGSDAPWSDLYEEDPDAPRPFEQYTIHMDASGVVRREPTPPPAPVLERVEAAGTQGSSAGQRLKGSMTWALRELWQFLMQILTAVLKFSFGPGLWITVPAFLIVVVVGGLLVTARMQVGAAQTRAEEAWIVLKESIDGEISAVNEIVALGGSSPLLTQRVEEYIAAAEGLEQSVAARGLVQAMKAETDRVRAAFAGTDRVGDLGMRVDRLHRARSEYEAALDAWREAASTGPAALAITLGAVSAPPTL